MEISELQNVSAKTADYKELDTAINDYKAQNLDQIKFNIIIKPAFISLIALVLSFFLDLSHVPFFGDVTLKIARAFFTNVNEGTVTSFQFWWLPLIVYAFFILMAYLAFNKLKIELAKSSSSETIDRVIDSYTSVVDSVSTALPLIGAALLLISVNLGPEIFRGLSVPFEIKALIVLALGKLFQPVLDQLGIEFQNLVTHIEDIKEKYFNQLQIEANTSVVTQLANFNKPADVPQIPVKELEEYKKVLEHIFQLSAATAKNFANVHTILQEITKIDSINPDKIEKLSSLAKVVTDAGKALSDEKALAGIKSLENIVTKR